MQRITWGTNTEWLYSTVCIENRVAILMGRIEIAGRLPRDAVREIQKGCGVRVPFASRVMLAHYNARLETETVS
jgi:hypothetical protein